MIGGMTGVTADVIPFSTVMGNRANLCGLNLIGLKRNKIKRDELNELRKVFKYIFFVKDKTLNFRVNKVKDKNYKFDSIKKILNFIDGDSKRSFCLP